jgi:predicted ATPase/class 3 adenylate cyclase
MGAGRQLPSGTVTFLFTDIERSTESAAALGDERWADALRTHRDLLRPSFDRRGGVEVATEGDGLFVAFSNASDAVDAAIDAQRAVEGHEWPGEVRLRVRMGLHTGEALVIDGDYVGHAVHKAKRVCDAGHGGQILLSAETKQSTAAEVKDLGPHRLKDLGEAQPLFQVVADGLEQSFPRLRSLEVLEHNLPVQLTSFVGRERELAEARELLARARLLTITGAGGSGKTRLALQLLAEVVPTMSGGVWFADLAPLTDGAVVADAVVDAVGATGGHVGDVTASIQKSPTERLVEFFGRREAVLLLDNCEHLLNACADVVSTLLSSCPHLRVVATTREPLGVAGEVSWRLPSLRTVDVEDPQPDDLVAIEATRLFLDRARQADPSFRPTAENARAIADICARLDGIPLAIELAASRVRMLEPGEIARRLDDRFKLLTGGSRTALPRQQTLRATVDWSYDLLSEPQQKLLDRLSIFAGGFTLDAVEDVCSDNLLPASDVLDVLTGLVDRSLVVRAGAMRFRLLDTVRHYAREKLVNSAAGADFRRRHMTYYAALELAMRRKIRGPDERAAMDALEADLENVRAAFDWALTEDPATALQIAGSWWFFGSRGHEFEIGRWAEAALAATPNEPSAARAAATLSKAFVAFWKAEVTEMLALLEQSKHMSIEVDDAEGASMALLMQMTWSAIMGSPGRSVRYAMEALDLAHRWQRDRLEVDARYYIARSDPSVPVDARRTAFETAATAYHDAGDWHTESDAQRSLGNLARSLRDWDTAAEAFTRAVELAERAGCMGCIALSRLELAALKRGGRDLSEAAVLVRQVLETCRALQSHLFLSLTLGTGGRVVAAAGHHDASAALIASTDEVMRRNHLFVAPHLVPIRQRWIEQTRDAIGDEPLEAARERAATMTVNDMIAEALELLDRV